MTATLTTPATATATEDIDPAAVREGIMLGSVVISLLEKVQEAHIRQGRQALADNLADGLQQARRLLAQAKAELDG
jgi:hypothetical protein